jgi:hypothetical protein
LTGQADAQRFFAIEPKEPDNVMALSTAKAG